MSSSSWNVLLVSTILENLPCPPGGVPPAYLPSICNSDLMMSLISIVILLTVLQIHGIAPLRVRVGPAADYEHPCLLRVELTEASSSFASNLGSALSPPSIRSSPSGSYTACWSGAYTGSSGGDGWR